MHIVYQDHGFWRTILDFKIGTFSTGPLKEHPSHATFLMIQLLHRNKFY